MKKDKSTEKQFIEYLDRLLAGEEITVDDEVSDDMRTALEFARKMLAFREGPSDAFRADLRDKLLRQVTEQQAATPPAKRAGFREWAANLFPQRTAMVALTTTALAVLLLFVGVVWYASRTSQAPMATTAPSPPPSAAEYSVSLPANIIPEGVTFTAETSLSAKPGQATVYKVQSASVTTESVTTLGRKLGFSGEASLVDNGSKIVMSEGTGENMRQLTAWTASGAVEYGYVEPEKLYPSYPPELPSQPEAELIAYDFLQQADLLPHGYQSFAKVKDETTVIAGGGYSVSQRYVEEAPPPAATPSAPTVPWEKTTPSAPPGTTYWLVSFPHDVNGASATGPGSKIEVSVGDGGEVVRLLWSWRRMSPLDTDNIISEKQAYQELIQGRGSLDVPLDCRQVVVEQVQLKYWLDPPSEKQAYAVPVYEFKGKCLDKNGSHLEDFTAWTPALSSTY